MVPDSLVSLKQDEINRRAWSDRSTANKENSAGDGYVGQEVAISNEVDTLPLARKTYMLQDQNTGTNLASETANDG